MTFIAWVLFAWILTLGLIGLSTCAFIVYRRRIVTIARQSQGKRPRLYGPRGVAFHAAEGCSKTLIQRCFRQCLFGRVLTAAWVVVMVVAFIVMASFAVCTYFPEVAQAFGTDWDGIAGAFIISFAIFHVMAILLIELYGTLVVALMLPCSPAEASHLLIEEAVPVALDESGLAGPSDTGDEAAPSLLSRFLTAFNRLVAGYRRTRCRTLLRVRDDETDGAKSVAYTCVRYRYAAVEDSFVPAAGGIEITPSIARRRLLHGGLAQDEYVRLQRLIGRNEITVQLPTVFQSLVAEFSSVFYVIQSMGCWVDLGYYLWNVGALLLVVMLVTGSVKALTVVRPQKKKLHELAQHDTDVVALRDGEWTTTRSTDVVMGDLLRVDEQQELLCDGFLLDGTAVLDESALTGEPMPVHKVAVEEGCEDFDRRNAVYAGTRCVQSSGSSDERAVMVVSAIGGLTTKGQMIRLVMFPEPVRFKYHDQLPLVYLGLFVDALLLSVAFFVFTHIGSWVVTILQVLIVVKETLNPMLPVAMVMGQTVAAKRLRNHHKIFCLQPERIPVAGKISVMVFDKTGTITKDGMELSAVLPARECCFEKQVQLAQPSTPSTLAEPQPYGDGGSMGVVAGDLRLGLACCHSVVRLADGTLSGDQVELAMLNASGWKLSDSDEGPVVSSPDGARKLSIIRRMHFDRETMTSGCVIRSALDGQLAVYVKGSPESIRDTCRSDTLPHDYAKICADLAGQNFYVLALSCRRLPPRVAVEEMVAMPREVLEKDLRLVGLLLFKNEVKPDSALAINMLREGDVRSVVCTGDNPLTAIGISKEVGIIDTTRPVLLGDVDQQQRLVWSDPDQSSLQDIIPIKGVHQLVVTQYLRHGGIFIMKNLISWRSIGMIY